MKEYELLSKLLEDIIQQMEERNICEDNTDSEMPPNECINKENIEKQKFDIRPYLSQKEERYHTSIVESQMFITGTDNYELLASLNQEQSEFLHI